MTNPWEPLIDALRDAPDDFVLAWYSDGMAPDEPWEVGYVSVWLGNQRAWTIVAPWEGDDVGHDIAWPPDLVCLQMVTPSPECNCGHCLSIHAQIGIPVRPDEEEVAALRDAVAAAQEGHEGFWWIGSPGWSEKAVRHAIEDWCLRHVGRYIQARWDAEHGPSPMLQSLSAFAQAITDGTEPVYMVQPGAAEGGEGATVYASETAMELLVQAELLGDDPDTL